MLRRFALTALAAAALTACNNDTTVRADVATATDTLVAYASRGTPSTYPSALNIIAGVAVRPTGAADFDVAFDIDSSGKVVVMPSRLVVTPLAGAPLVGIKVFPESTFTSITRAPNGYYRPDTAVTVAPGVPFIILTTRSPLLETLSTVCLYVSTPRLYAKVVIDSVNTTTRAIHFREVRNPNCGFRSFLPGLPAN